MNCFNVRHTHTLSIHPSIYLSISSMHSHEMCAPHERTVLRLLCSVLFCSVSILFGVVAAVVVHTNEGKRGTRPWNSTKSISRSRHTHKHTLSTWIVYECVSLVNGCECIGSTKHDLYLYLCERSMRCSNGLHHPPCIRASVCVRVCVVYAVYSIVACRILKQRTVLCLSVFFQPIHFRKIQKIFGFFPLEFSVFHIFRCCCFVLRFHIFKCIAAYFILSSSYHSNGISIAHGTMVMVMVIIA